MCSLSPPLFLRTFPLTKMQYIVVNRHLTKKFDALDPLSPTTTTTTLRLATKVLKGDASLDQEALRMLELSNAGNHEQRPIWTYFFCQFSARLISRDSYHGRLSASRLRLLKGNSIDLLTSYGSKKLQSQ